VRFALAILFVATFVQAGEDEDLARTVDRLVEALGARSAETRALARFRLASYGDRIRPLLERVDSPDPEVRRVILMLTRREGKVEIELLPRAQGPLAIGATLSLDVRVINNTDQTITLLPEVARQGPAAPFRFRVGKAVVPLAFDQVNGGGDGPATIAPGGVRRFSLSLSGGSPSLRKPGLYDVSVIFDGLVGQGYGETEEGVIETRQLVLETPSVEVHVLGRKVEDLEKALASDDERERNGAVTELTLRDDDAVVPILRRHAKERPLRYAAIRRLAMLGAKEDFQLIYDATNDEMVEVRRAAALGLGKYQGFKPRSRLRALSRDPDVQAEVVRALREHKHHATIECFLDLLPLGRCSRETALVIRATIFEWTGISVSQRQSEIEEFRRWWEMNREEWAKKNEASDK